MSLRWHYPDQINGQLRVLAAISAWMTQAPVSIM